MSTKKESEENNLDIPYQGLKDFLFESIVRTLNVTQTEFGMTIQCNGLIISGILIGIRQYYDELLNAAPDNDFIKSIHSLKDQLSTEERIKSDDQKGVLANYFHLKEARFYSDAARPFPSNGTLWRGKISEVNGFAFGTLAY
jgi:hypothetical protein